MARDSKKKKKVDLEQFQEKSPDIIEVELESENIGTKLSDTIELNESAFNPPANNAN